VDCSSATKVLLLIHPFTSTGLVALGLAVALAAGSLSETLLINTYFHILFRMCAHLKVRSHAVVRAVVGAW